MPAQVLQVGERLAFVAQLLGVVLAEIPLARGVGLLDQRERLLLGDGHQRDLRGVTTDAAARRSDPDPHLRDALGQGGHFPPHGKATPAWTSSSTVSRIGSPTTFDGLPSTASICVP